MTEGIGDRIRRLRDGSKLTQKGLADLCGFESMRISKYENGHSAPSPEALDKLATALGVSIDFLVRGDEGAPSDLAEGAAR